MTIVWSLCPYFELILNNTHSRTQSPWVIIFPDLLRCCMQQDEGAGVGANRFYCEANGDRLECNRISGITNRVRTRASRTEEHRIEKHF